MTKQTFNLSSFMKQRLFRNASRKILFSLIGVLTILSIVPQKSIAKINVINGVLQRNAIKGRILDATGEPVIGATIKVKGTTNGALSDLDGYYTINAQVGDQLEISYIGYKTRTIKAVQGLNNIILQEDSKNLNEVVVVGLILAAAMLLIDKNNFIDWKSVVIFVVSMALVLKWKMSPILLTVIAAIVGIIIY